MWQGSLIKFRFYLVQILIGVHFFSFDIPPNTTTLQSLKDQRRWILLDDRFALRDVCRDCGRNCIFGRIQISAQSMDCFRLWLFMLRICGAIQLGFGILNSSKSRFPRPCCKTNSYQSSIPELLDLVIWDATICCKKLNTNTRNIKDF